MSLQLNKVSNSTVVLQSFADILVENRAKLFKIVVESVFVVYCCVYIQSLLTFC